MGVIENILEKVTTLLTEVNGVQGVVLGGSRASGTHTEDSDIDIGIYYDEKNLDIGALNLAAQSADDERREKLIASPGEWGKWVNGGGWLTMNGIHVDFILRDAGRVSEIISECQRGIVTSHYQTGHPHAYISAMYMGELAVSKVLWDRDGSVTSMKRAAEIYPLPLKKALIGGFSFEAEFSLMFVKSNLDRDDTYYVVAHIVRAVSALNQVLFALNEKYCLNEKKAVRRINGFTLRPDGYKEKVDAIFEVIGEDISFGCARLQDLIDEVKSLIAE